MQPASDATGPSFLLMEPPALNRAMSTPLKLHSTCNHSQPCRHAFVATQQQKGCTWHCTCACGAQQPDCSTSQHCRHGFDETVWCSIHVASDEEFMSTGRSVFQVECLISTATTDMITFPIDVLKANDSVHITQTH